MTEAPAVPDVKRATAGLRLSDDLRVSLSPRGTYEALVLRGPRGSWRRALARAGFPFLIFATSASVTATAVVSVPTMISVAACWIFVPAIQFLTALGLCCRPPAARVSMARAVELVFLAHVPWSAWLIGAALAAVWIPPGRALVNLISVTLLVPAVWTPLLVAGFCCSVLGCTVAGARRRTLVHQATSWAVIAAYAILAIQPWSRIGGMP